MRTPTEALKEVRDRLTYFCARLDGKYDPPWAQELVGIIDDALAQDAPMSQGNAAKLREALIKLIEAVFDYHENAVQYIGRDIRSVMAAQINESRDALSAPPRNCDKYATEDAAMNYFGDEALIEEWNALKAGKDRDMLAKELYWFIRWLFAFATEQKGDR